MTTLENRTLSWVDSETHYEITKFLYDEAEALDEWRYGDWADYLTENFRYRVPIPITRDDPRRGAYATNGFIVDESRASLEYWFKRHESALFEYAWGENPLQRVQRFVSNIRARRRPDSDKIEVRAKVLVSFARQSEPAVLVTAERVDVLVPHEGSWRVEDRAVFLHQNVLDMTHMRLIF